MNPVCGVVCYGLASVCTSVCLSQVGVMPDMTNVYSNIVHYRATIANVEYSRG